MVDVLKVYYNHGLTMINSDYSNIITNKQTIAPANTSWAPSKEVAVKPIEFPETSTVTLSVEAQLANLSTTKFAVFEGKYTGLIMAESEKTEQMQTVMDRLPPKQAGKLVDSGFIDDDKFLAFAEKLSDSDLANFADTAMALMTPSKINRFSGFHTSGVSKAQTLMENLSAMDAETRSQVLEKTAELAQPVSYRDLNIGYLANGLQTVGSANGNDLHNFVDAIATLPGSDLSEGVTTMLTSLASFDNSQQSDLLQILANGAETGIRLMENLGEYGKDAQNALIGYMSELTKSISPFSISVEQKPAAAEWAGAILNYDDKSATVITSMVEKLTGLTEKYQMSDEQLLEMTDSLNSLDPSDQRAYIEITDTGLEKLLGSSEGPQINLSNHPAALDVLESLRSDDTVLNLVSRSRMGEERISNGQTFYEYKDSDISKADQRETIELLISDSFVHQNDSSRANRLAASLSPLEADGRDELVDELHALSQSDQALTKLPEETLKQSFEGFMNRSNSIVNSHELQALLTVAEEISEPQQEQFWQATALLGRGVDTLVETLQQQSPGGQKMLLEYLTALTEEVENGDLGRRQYQAQALDLLSLFETESKD